MSVSVNYTDANIQLSHKEIQTIRNKFDNELINFGKCILLGVGIFVLAKYSQICLGNIIPLSLQEVLKHSPTKKIYNYAMPALGMPIYANLLAPILEELENRFLFQEVLLKRMPKKIIEKVAPQYSTLVDSKIAKISRITLSTTLFILAHMEVYDGSICPTNYGFRTAALGIYTAYLTEKTGSIAAATLFHTLNNIVSS
ncbi:MAG TPA: CPBP family intramembrane glutamic endopeptidase [Parachlamydiaceae bacterium]|nr:CPBP family intramembrane glutamic endopeptidase [Parachlamydiaceae bacterium]